jgi:RNA polymerase sigma-70 factor (ECF subfamily)
MRVGADGGRAAAPGDGGRGEPIHPLIELYRVYERKLFRQCLTQLRNPSDAEDAVQETFARAARHLDQLEEDPAPYLATVARNVCRDEMQRRARCISTGDPAMFGELEVGHPETSTLDRDQLNAAWKRFTHRERQLIGRRFAGFSYDEIAGHLNMTPGALNMALARARKRARQVASVTVGGLAAAFSLRRMAHRAARSGSGTVALPSALMTAAAVTCVAVGVAGGNWLATSPGNALVAAAPTHLSAASQDPPGQAWTTVPTGSNGGSAADNLLQPSAPTPSPSAAPVHSLASSVIAPGQDATQEDAAFTSITPSPAYQQDRTVFASGTLANGCGRPTCPVIFWTRDGGSTWQHLAANGFLGGKLLLSPGYPMDRVMFATGPAGLQRSDDGGVSFQTVIPGPAPAAIDPTSPAGDARVFIAAQAPLIYNAASGKVQAGPTLPPGITAPTDVSYVGGRDVVIAANQVDPMANTLQDGVVVACPFEQGCHVTVVDTTQPALNLAVSPHSASGDTLFVWSPSELRASRDHGASFTAIPIPPGGLIHTVATPMSEALGQRLVVAEGAGSSADDRLLQSLNAGNSFARVDPIGLAQVVTASLLLLPDGHEIAAVATSTGTVGFGIRCSADGGMRWARSC